MARSLRQVIDAHAVLRAAERSILPRVRGLVRRFTLGRAVQGTTDTVRANGSTFGESATEAENLQEYGVASLPPPGSEGVHIKPLGVVLCLDSRANRPLLSAGEVVLYSEHGQTIRLKGDGSVIVAPKAGQNVELAGDPASDFVALAAKVDAELAKIQTALNTHVHPGVTTGPGSTGIAASGYTPAATAASRVRAS